MNKPTIVERYADNGEHSHWELVNDNGEVLWDEAEPLPVATGVEEAQAPDEFIQKHLDIIYGKMKQAAIARFIKPMYDSLDAASIEYFLQKGTVNGGFLRALNEMMDSMKGWSKSPAASQSPVSDAVGFAEFLRIGMWQPYGGSKWKKKDKGTNALYKVTTELYNLYHHSPHPLLNKRKNQNK